jgi:hypothetical protein
MTAERLRIKVESYAGYRNDEIPRCFYMGDRKIDVEEILDRWIAPDHRYFKLRGGDECVYILRHDVVNDFWELTMFSSGGIDELRLSST